MIDTAWFKRRIEETPQGSLRRLAADFKSSQGLPMNHAALSLIINGKQVMTVSDAVQLAKAFGVDVEEVIRRAGFRL